MDTKNMQIKKMSTDHLEQYNRLLRYAFQVTEKKLLNMGWEDEEIRQSKFPVLENAYVLGYFDEGELVSQFAVYPIKMNIHSEIYSVGFVTSVSTYPEYTGLGLMSKLMKQSLTHMRDSGQSLALLYPFSIPLYRHKGWEIISDKMTYQIKDTQLPKDLQAPGHVKRVAYDSEDLFHLHKEFARQTHGCLLRNELAWDEYWRWDVDDTIVAIYYNVDGKPTGYVVYLIKDDIFYVKEMVYLNFEAQKGLMKYVCAHESMVYEVRGSNYFSEPIAFRLTDSDIKETIRPYIMGRIVDFEAFIQDYNFEKDAADTSVTFHVSDSILDWNHRSFTVAVQNGKCKIVTEESAHAVSLSIGTLTALLLGYKSAAQLSGIEHIEASPETIKLIDSILITEKPYISDYI